MGKVCFDRASRYISVIKTNLCTIYPQFISSIDLYMFRAYLYSIIRKYTVYIQQLVTCCAIQLTVCWPGLDGQQTINWKAQHVPIVVYIQYTSS